MRAAKRCARWVLPLPSGPVSACAKAKPIDPVFETRHRIAIAVGDQEIDGGIGGCAAEIQRHLNRPCHQASGLTGGSDGKSPE